MHRKRFTFILIPPNDGQVQEYRLTPRILAIAGMVAFIFLCAFGYYFTGFYSRADHQENLAQLRAENGELLRSIEHTRGVVYQLEKTMVVLREDDEKLRNYHQMEPLSADERLAGTGGPDEPPQLSSVLPARKRAALEDLNVDILRLQREAKIQEESFSLLENKFRESEEGWKHFPTISPVSSDHSWVSSRFGYRSDPFTGRSAFHSGLDFAGRRGTPVYATADGTVNDAYRDTGLGNTVVIDHDIVVTDENGKPYKKEGIYQTEYGHLEKMLVSPGQRVSRGQQIATMGNTGRSTGPHLHYGVLYKDRRMGRKGYVDPENFILDMPNALEKLAGLGPIGALE
jgi:murein DD-endopeptidase MepM/ murein hydrolase activator NlpD